MRLYYAQNREDLLIKSFFPDVTDGFYVDVGANDPVVDSVTKLFYDEGWSGINIEPIKKHAADLNRLRPRDANLNIGLSDKAGELSFREYLGGDGLSTFDTAMHEYYEQGQQSFPTDKFKEYKVPIKTLAEVIAENKVDHIHFIKIDVEGFEYELINGYDWQKIRPELICIEATHINKDWRPLLKRHKYKLVFFDGVNNYYLAEEAKDREAYFNYENATFAGNPVYYPASLEIEKQLSLSFEQEKEKLMDVLNDREHRIAFLNQQQRDVRFLSKRLTEEIQLRLNKRTQRAPSSAGLAYNKDKTLEAKLQSMPSGNQEKVEFIHARDKENIRRRRPKMKDKVGARSWKLVALSFNLFMAILNKIARRIK